LGLLIYCFIALWFVGGLTGFHLYLISTNQVSFFDTRLSNSCSFFLLDHEFVFMNASSFKIYI
jgi:hypothetical protein